jgi:hypothetical protein
METNPDRLRRLLADIDAFNDQDPNQDVVNGAARPRERVYAERLTAWVLKLNPDASEALRIAARGQHIGRWTSPRDTYPMDRGGYLRWREDLKRYHAQTVGGLMEKAGYSPEERERVRLLILKKNIHGDPDTQTLEDALCLIFLESQFEDLKRKTPDEKMIDIIQKTWRKMSAQGRDAALSLPLPPEHAALVKAALQ